jgi:redox-sensitive bicupin YhaK (pirin superfamily)
MIPANYQHVKAEDFPLVITDDSKARIKIIAGQLKDEQGPIETQTSVNAYILELEAGAEVKLPIEATHNSLLYLVKGKVRVNNQEVLELDKHQFLEFNNDGVGIEMESSAKSLLLFLSGEPFHEKVSSWGPYVMNTQTEIMEAMRDYQMGKMGFLPAN